MTTKNGKKKIDCYSDPENFPALKQISHMHHGPVAGFYPLVCQLL